MWETAQALVAKLDAGHLLIVLLFGSRELQGWYREKEDRRIIGEALTKLNDSITGMRVLIAAIRGKPE